MILEFLIHKFLKKLVIKEVYKVLKEKLTCSDNYDYKEIQQGFFI